MGSHKESLVKWLDSLLHQPIDDVKSPELFHEVLSMCDSSSKIIFDDSAIASTLSRLVNPTNAGSVGETYFMTNIKSVFASDNDEDWLKIWEWILYAAVHCPTAETLMASMLGLAVCDQEVLLSIIQRCGERLEDTQASPGPNIQSPKKRKSKAEEVMESHCANVRAMTPSPGKPLNPMFELKQENMNLDHENKKLTGELEEIRRQLDEKLRMGSLTEEKLATAEFEAFARAEKAEKENIKLIETLASLRTRLDEKQSDRDSAEILKCKEEENTALQRKLENLRRKLEDLGDIKKQLETQRRVYEDVKEENAEYLKELTSVRGSLQEMEAYKKLAWTAKEEKTQMMSTVEFSNQEMKAMEARLASSESNRKEIEALLHETTNQLKSLQDNWAKRFGNPGGLRDDVVIERKKKRLSQRESKREDSQKKVDSDENSEGKDHEKNDQDASENGDEAEEQDAEVEEENDEEEEQENEEDEEDGEAMNMLGLVANELDGGGMWSNKGGDCLFEPFTNELKNKMESLEAENARLMSMVATLDPARVKELELSLKIQEDVALSTEGTKNRLERDMKETEAELIIEKGAREEAEKKFAVEAEKARHLQEEDLTRLNNELAVATEEWRAADEKAELLQQQLKETEDKLSFNRERLTVSEEEGIQKDEETSRLRSENADLRSDWIETTKDKLALKVERDDLEKKLLFIQSQLNESDGVLGEIGSQLNAPVHNNARISVARAVIFIIYALEEKGRYNYNICIGGEETYIIINFSMRRLLDSLKKLYKN
eukprot:GHVL01033688.1.p1 GENE.GHVL01033688.1~~GHVL01033688.1.p1  ORF type:complete len:777 (-),score=214.34 GHVL01033688.1:1051-3381(-)